jgi:tungstate transport system substrate-binding protein
MILAAATGAQDSGLLDALLPAFEKETGYSVKTIAVGSGRALTMGRKGEADVLLVNYPDAEKQFMKDGLGSRRLLVMHNDFIIVGPDNDPAKIRGLRSSVDAFRKIAAAGALFISRGVNSGTHARERIIWWTAGIQPEREKWYQQTGLGMGQTLQVASQRRGYTLADRGTYLAARKRIALELLVQGDGNLLNVYHVIEVNASNQPKVNAAGARAFADFLVSPRARKIIGNFGKEEFGSPLFFPGAGKSEDKPGR